MKGHYDYYKDYCRCGSKLIYLGMRDLDGNEVNSWPVDVYNINTDNIGHAETKSEYLAVWNSDPYNNEIGTLITGMGPFGFQLLLTPGQAPPDWVLGVPSADVDTGIYALQYEEVYE